MPSRYTTAEYYHRFYEPWHGSLWPDTGPNLEQPIYQSYSDDLLVTTKHKVSDLGDKHSDIGGPFHAVKRNYECYGTFGDQVMNITSESQGRYGGFRRTPQFARHATFSNDHFPNVEPSSDLYSLGRRAIAALAPTASSFNGAEFVGELREGLPHIVPFLDPNVRSKLDPNRKVGGEYLNYQFGIKPLMSDWKKFSNTIKNSKEILDEYERNSNQLLRRKMNFPPEMSVDVSEDTQLGAAPLIDQTNMWDGGGYWGTLQTTTTRKRRVWFSGAFSYYFPPRSDAMRRAEEANKLLGTNVTPETLWNLAPWSWAIDWFSDAGALAKNLSLFQTDGLTMPWAYIMEEKSVKVEYRLTGLRYSYIYDDAGNRYTESPTLHQTYETVCKTRLQASPYGFQLFWPDFTERQLMILQALGQSRA